MEYKICGLRNKNDISIVCDFENIKYCGLIIAKSIRKVSIDNINEYSQILKKNQKEVVIVMSEDELDHLDYLLNLDSIDIIQAHFELNEQLVSKITKKKKLWNVKSIKDKSLNIKNYDKCKILFDYKGKQLGGNSKSFDWNLISGYSDYILAGGIGIDNFLDAHKTSASIIDMNSKLENDFGKDYNKVKEINYLINEVRNG